jgi:hypothetical protein
VLATALRGIIASLQELLEHFFRLMHTPGGITDQALWQLDQLHNCALHVEMEWATEV